VDVEEKRQKQTDGIWDEMLPKNSKFKMEKNHKWRNKKKNG